MSDCPLLCWLWVTGVIATGWGNGAGVEWQQKQR
jgi:hypothetical protein